MWKPIILDVECIVCNKTLQKFEHNPREVSKKMGKITNTNRRSRTPNWSLQEKQHLLNLIKARKEVVVTKSNNGPNHSEEKDAAWNEILSELATKFGNKFIGSSTKKVKTQWQNMKRIAREEIALHHLEMHKYTKLSLEVCHILELFKDGVFNIESEHLNDTILTTDVEIKTECIDEDCNPQENTSISNNSIEMDVDLIREHNINALKLNYLNASTSSASDQQSNVFEIAQLTSVSPLPKKIELKDAAAMTDSPFPDLTTFNSFQKEMKEFLTYSAEEKALKMEALKEERQVIRAMRETAELNKITAEQRLKHMLWVKKQESAMYSGEPGSGAGRGGGGGGAIREAGGTFGKMEAAREDEYFYKKQKEQLANLKNHLDKEISFHQDQIKRHEDAIRRHKEQMTNIEHK